MAILSALLAAMSACAAESPLPPNSAQMPIALTTIQKGNFSGISEPLQTVIRAQAEWESLWKHHTSIQSPPSPLPSVDFRMDMIAAVFLGQKSTGGYEIEITGADFNNSVLNISYVIRSPVGGGPAIQALTQPFHIVKLPRSEAQGKFSRSSL
jgi:PrcB C-terminal